MVHSAAPPPILRALREIRVLFLLEAFPAAEENERGVVGAVVSRSARREAIALREENKAATAKVRKKWKVRYAHEEWVKGTWAMYYRKRLGSLPPVS